MDATNGDIVSGFAFFATGIQVKAGLNQKPTQYQNARQKMVGNEYRKHRDGKIDQGWYS